MEISQEDWYNMCKNQRRTTNSRMWKEFCWKNLVRFYITPKLKRRLSPVPQPCWRLCGEYDVDHVHVFWKCGKMTGFWNDVWEGIKSILQYDLPKTFEVLYLGNFTPKNIHSRDRYLTGILLAASKKAITRKWLKEDPPTQRNWLDIVDEIHDMEKFTYSLRLQQLSCFEKWEKWTDFKTHHKI